MTKSEFGRLSRRTSLGLLGGLAALPLARKIVPPAKAQPVSKTRISLQAFMQDPGRMNSLMQGVAVMKQRPPSDPTSWFFQAAIHGVRPEAVQQAEQADPNVANVDQARFWNQCPHFGQTSANFLLWHRGYLHYFEEILAQAAGDPTLALPYWDYTNTAQRMFPPPFAAPFLDQAQTIPNPLHHEERDRPFAFGLFELSDAAVDFQSANQETRFFGPQDNQGFAGGNSDNSPGTQGLIERIPHNMIHFAVGGSVGAVAGAMGSVQTAAFDPIFWVHHAMIDKLWADWMCLPGRQWGTLPDDAWFDETPWAFHDASGAVVEEPRRGFMDHHALGYAYDTEDSGCIPLQLPSAPIMAAAAASGEGAMNTDVLVDLDVSATIGTEALAVNLTEDLDASVFESAAASPARFTVEIDGVQIRETPLMGYDVYLVDAERFEAPDRSHPGYLGALALFGLGHGGDAERDGSSQSFNATAAMAAMEDPTRAAMLVLPFDLLVPSANPAAGVDPSIAEERANALGAITFSTVRLLKN